jgi:hypothetical protein
VKQLNAQATRLFELSERRHRYSAEQKLRLVKGAKQCFAQAAGLAD